MELGTTYGIFILILIVLGVLLALLGYVFCVIMLIDAAKKKDMFWALILLISLGTGVLPLVMAIIYYASVYRKD